MDIAELKYSTYTIAPSALVAPRLILQLDVNGDGKFDATNDYSIIFDPSAQPPFHKPGGVIPPVELDTWQEWDALQGNWTAMPDNFHLGVFTLQVFMKANMNARIINTDASTGLNAGPGIRFTVPAVPAAYYDFRGYIDAIKIKTMPLKSAPTDTLYDFACPEFKYPILHKPLWPFYRSPFIIISLFVVALIGYSAYRKIRSK
jgi:hypothetical protein